MRGARKRIVRLPNGSHKKYSSLYKIADAPNVEKVRSRLKSVRLVQHLLRGQLALYAYPGTGVRSPRDSFAPLVDSIRSLENATNRCEDILLVYAWGHLEAEEFEAQMRDALTDFECVVEGCYPAGQENPELEHFCEAAWHAISRLVPWLQDAALGSHEPALPDLWRLAEFQSDFEKNLTGSPLVR